MLGVVSLPEHPPVVLYCDHIFYASFSSLIFSIVTDATAISIK